MHLFLQLVTQLVGICMVLFKTLSNAFVHADVTFSLHNRPKQKKKGKPKKDAVGDNDN